MQQNRYIGIFLLVLGFCLGGNIAHAQLGFSFDIPKPKQYEDRQLKSEKTEQKKFTVPRRFVQNTITHYNYFFNANNKLNEIVARAKEAHRDDLTQLLSFYNYDLDVTARDSVQLDSVIYKATSGIVLHDLRNNWADNLYLLWGAAHYLQKEFDSAYLTFQFINYAFAPKEKDGYYQYIGSNMDGNSAISISTNEKRNLPKKILSRPPSRNEAFIWQIRTFLAWEQYPEAASLIATLKADPVFPDRLRSDLDEVQALYFYKQGQWDSSAIHLTNALGNATNAQERARWEFLSAQMYELAGNSDLAQHYYEKSAGLTVDPVMAVYARLYSIRVDKTGGEHYIEKNIDELLKMARHDRFVDYRDIIYYMAAQMEIDRHDPAAARELLLKSAKYNNGNIAQRNKTYLKLGELAFNAKDYRNAANFYDSLILSDPSLKDINTINKKKEVLNKLAFQTEILDRQDSLQRIAALPEDQRKEFVKKLLKDMRKQAGLKEGETTVITGGSGFTPVTDMFNSSQSTKGEWYFYNTTLRQKGASDFKMRWGTRPNVDNWRRIQAVTNQISNRSNSNNNNAVNTIPGDNSQKTNQPEELTFDNLYKNLPLTDDQVKISNDSIQNALFELGKIYAEDLEDCDAVISTYERLRNKYPQFAKMDDVMFRLYYCYNKNGNTDKAGQLKSEMSSKYPNSNLTSIITSGKDPKAEQNAEATKTYEKIYDQFIEGNFDEALAQKKMADSLYGENYWTPQLLYIESVYFIKQRNDSTAIDELKKIQSKYPSSPLAARATTMIDVLKRRKQIEEELTNLQINKSRSEVTQQPQPKVITDTVVSRPMIAKTDTSAIKRPITKSVSVDSVTKKTAAPIAAFAFNALAPHYVMIILNKVDVVFGNEAKNAFARYNSQKYYNKTFELNTITLDADHKLVLIKPFDNAQAAIDYINDVKPRAATEIVPWLKADKYSFSIITDPNLEILKSNLDLTTYKLFLDQNLPGKF
ncbi:MAG TPA: tetratricopeptide repeat protein [Chitinophagaceae bacterium]